MMLDTHVINNFVGKNRAAIWHELSRATRGGALRVRDFILEVDFMVDGRTGTAPGLRTPAEFKVGPTKDYMTGKLKPVWGKTPAATFELLLDAKDNLKSDGIMVLMRLPSGTLSAGPLCVPN